VTIPLHQATAFDLPSPESSGPRPEQNGGRSGALNNVVADYERVSVARDTSVSVQEETPPGEVRSSNEHSLRYESIDEKVTPFSKRRFREINTPSLTPISEWEGYVEDIDEEEFTVRLVDTKSSSSLPEDLATFRKSELSQRDRELLVPGAIVRWVVGLERLPSDQRRRVSELHFRNLPAHSTRDFDRAKKRARDLIESIDLDEST